MLFTHECKECGLITLYLEDPTLRTLSDGRSVRRIGGIVDPMTGERFGPDDLCDSCLKQKLEELRRKSRFSKE